MIPISSITAIPVSCEKALLPTGTYSQPVENHSENTPVTSYILENELYHNVDKSRIITQMKNCREVKTAYILAEYKRKELRMKTLYTAQATATGGREGGVQTDDGKLSFKLDKPGGNGAGTNPEQLFACGYAACFSGAAQYIAKQMNLEIGEITVKADINLNSVDDGFKLSGVMDVSLPQLDKDDAIKLVQDTHKFCPYSRATKGNIDIVLKVNGEEIPA